MGLISSLFQLVYFALYIYSFAIIIYVFMSWFPGARESSFGTFLAKICEPYMEIFRKFIPPLGMIDISPIVAIFVLILAREGIMSLQFMLFVVI
ncbi:putative membrane protein YlmG [Lentibacillus sp. JNUCC-1]|uniref:YggT family protein n=1 Tax=Lentibacillus sp. JNUCC-1 TaxID=2654513 RepID=UPI0012E87C58|nr:YggT family protein [Lentibacillus sp. JNUCC-1]MUV36207.1 putative membrane protein YlmG [Lentibacillus sp. JNUCC-1]